MYSRILVPLDGSSVAEQVLPHVRLLGKKTGTKVDLLQVIELQPDEIAAREQGVYMDEIVGNVLERERKKLNQVAAALKRDGIKVSVTVEEGKPAEYIVTEAEKQPDTLIAMATHGRSGLYRWITGSVTAKVLHSTRNPVLVVRARKKVITRAEKIETIIVPLDGSKVAEKALPYAQDIAKTTGAAILLVRVIDLSAFYFGYTEHVTTTYPHLSEHVESNARRYVNSVAKRLTNEGVIDVKGVAVDGSPAAVLVDTAKEYANSMVVMTTHGHSGVTSWVMGSVADHVVRHSGDSVLMIRTAVD